MSDPDEIDLEMERMTVPNCCRRLVDYVDSGDFWMIPMLSERACDLVELLAKRFYEPTQLEKWHTVALPVLQCPYVSLVHKSILTPVEMTLALGDLMPNYQSRGKLDVNVIVVADAPETAGYTSLLALSLLDWLEETAAPKEGK